MGGTTGHSRRVLHVFVFLLICKCLKDVKAERGYTAKERRRGQERIMGGMHKIEACYRQVMEANVTRLADLEARQNSVDSTILDVTQLKV